MVFLMSLSIAEFAFLHWPEFLNFCIQDSIMQVASGFRKPFFGIISIRHYGLAVWRNRAGDKSFSVTEK